MAQKTCYFKTFFYYYFYKLHSGYRELWHVATSHSACLWPIRRWLHSGCKKKGKGVFSVEEQHCVIAEITRYFSYGIA